MESLSESEESIIEMIDEELPIDDSEIQDENIEKELELPEEKADIENDVIENKLPAEENALIQNEIIEKEKVNLILVEILTCEDCFSG